MSLTVSGNALVSPLNAGGGDSFLTVGSYNPSEFSSPAATEDFSEEQLPLYLGKYVIYVLIQNEKTQRQVFGIAKELKKIHRDVVQNTTNSVTVVAVLLASIAFLDIFNLPGLYLRDGPKAGKARISNTIAFRVFCLSILQPCSFLLQLSSFRLPSLTGTRELINKSSQL
ncbi:Ankyrin repeat-containing protein [Abeliophyllum distichum]|uniref:Ankyrin repeat-containing protein n=1 Tax=Abeliophyllum distichum TaxID=126358 RepID=A0ABD1PM94_9LAMI